MLGSRDAEILPWKLCLKSVLRRDVSIDSPPEGAVLNGPFFGSLALLRGGDNSHQLYTFTVAPKAAELARRPPSPELEALKDPRWFHPRFPGAPADVRSALSMWSMCPLVRRRQGVSGGIQRHVSGASGGSCEPH